MGKKRVIRNQKLKFKLAGKWCPSCNKVKLTKFKNTYGQLATCDHILPVSMMGNSTIQNMKVICFACNQAKGSKMNLLEILPIFDKVIDVGWEYAPKDLAQFSLAKQKNFNKQLRKHGVMI